MRITDPVRYTDETRRAGQALQGMDCGGYCTVLPRAPFGAGVFTSPAVRGFPATFLLEKWSWLKGKRESKTKFCSLQTVDLFSGWSIFGNIT